ncbi:MAG TPA: hypothetical protein VLJ62_32535, partial [Burkholderiaceae bacterium]|nr:hypothetical protein [Burkholderiaceae bacterium]
MAPAHAAAQDVARPSFPPVRCRRRLVDSRHSRDSTAAAMPATDLQALRSLNAAVLSDTLDSLGLM